MNHTRIVTVGLKLFDQRQKFINGKSGTANQFTQSSNGEFLVVGNGEVGANPVSSQHYVAPDLAADRPPCSLKGLDGLLARYVC